MQATVPAYQARPGFGRYGPFSSARVRSRPTEGTRLSCRHGRVAARDDRLRTGRERLDRRLDPGGPRRAWPGALARGGAWRTRSKRGRGDALGVSEPERNVRLGV